MVTPYRPPVYLPTPIMNQPIIFPEPVAPTGWLQGYPSRPAYPTYPVYPSYSPEPMIPIYQMQPAPTTIVRERYLPAPHIRCHSSPRYHNDISTPSTIINKITNSTPILNTSPPPPPMRHIQVNQRNTYRFPRPLSIHTVPMQPIIKPAMKTMTTINRTTRRSTHRLNGRH
ncbi:uncharacterized protein IL334_005456 [Kwoniella shivajii]|uniref:Uncharacterized protein n=1 Tax=Kwoniella shivajii TaxID=564305 RepID=A0ABZ1D528_9TREE|nr:hypothetical protein IL334_005456 [Kwoniella shivajii]